MTDTLADMDACPTGRTPFSPIELDHNTTYGGNNNPWEAVAARKATPKRLFGGNDANVPEDDHADARSRMQLLYVGATGPRGDGSGKFDGFFWIAGSCNFFFLNGSRCGGAASTLCFAARVPWHWMLAFYRRWPARTYVCSGGVTTMGPDFYLAKRVQTFFFPLLATVF